MRSGIGGRLLSAVSISYSHARENLAFAIEMLASFHLFKFFC